MATHKTIGDQRTSRQMERERLDRARKITGAHLDIGDEGLTVFPEPAREIIAKITATFCDPETGITGYEWVAMRELAGGDLAEIPDFLGTQTYNPAYALNRKSKFGAGDVVRLRSGGGGVYYWIEGSVQRRFFARLVARTTKTCVDAACYLPTDTFTATITDKTGSLATLPNSVTLPPHPTSSVNWLGASEAVCPAGITVSFGIPFPGTLNGQLSINNNAAPFVNIIETKGFSGSFTCDPFQVVFNVVADKACDGSDAAAGTAIVTVTKDELDADGDDQYEYTFVKVKRVQNSEGCFDWADDDDDPAADLAHEANNQPINTVHNGADLIVEIIEVTTTEAQSGSGGAGSEEAGSGDQECHVDYVFIAPAVPAGPGGGYRYKCEDGKLKEYLNGKFIQNVLCDVTCCIVDDDGSGPDDDPDETGSGGGLCCDLVAPYTTVGDLHETGCVQLAGSGFCSNYSGVNIPVQRYTDLEDFVGAESGWSGRAGWGGVNSGQRIIIWKPGNLPGEVYQTEHCLMAYVSGTNPACFTPLEMQSMDCGPPIVMVFGATLFGGGSVQATFTLPSEDCPP